VYSTLWHLPIGGCHLYTSYRELTAADPSMILPTYYCDSELSFRRIVNVKVVPYPISEINENSPQNSFTSFCEIIRPKPIPLVFLFSVSLRKPKS
jgi:hypothetical protein